MSATARQHLVDPAPADLDRERGIGASGRPESGCCFVTSSDFGRCSPPIWSDRLAVLRGIGVAGALALTHVGSAVVLALAAAPILSRTLGGVGRAPVLEDISRGLLALIGLWFLWRAWRGPLHEHREGVMVGVIAGLVPCPLTLFAMFLALSRGVPEAGLTFALA